MEDIENDSPTFTLCLFKIQKMLFKFERFVPVGQYVFPFTFVLPNNLPNSFKTKLVNDELYSISYTFRVFFDSDEPIL